jgi:hypothetical protein
MKYKVTIKFINDTVITFLINSIEDAERIEHAFSVAEQESQEYDYEFRIDENK